MATDLLETTSTLPIRWLVVKLGMARGLAQGPWRQKAQCNHINSTGLMLAIYGIKMLLHNITYSGVQTRKYGKKVAFILECRWTFKTHQRIFTSSHGGNFYQKSQREIFWISPTDIIVIMFV